MSQKKQFKFKLYPTIDVILANDYMKANNNIWMKTKVSLFTLYHFTLHEYILCLLVTFKWVIVIYQFLFILVQLQTNLNNVCIYILHI